MYFCKLKLFDKPIKQKVIIQKLLAIYMMLIAYLDYFC